MSSSGSPIIIAPGHGVDLEALSVQITQQLDAEFKRLGVHRKIQVGVLLWDGSPRTYYCCTPGADRNFVMSLRQVLAWLSRPKVGG